MTALASGLSAYRSESGSSSATRHTPSCLSQNADQHRCSERKAVIPAAVGCHQRHKGSRRQSQGRVGTPRTCPAASRTAAARTRRQPADHGRMVAAVRSRPHSHRARPRAPAPGRHRRRRPDLTCCSARPPMRRSAWPPGTPSRKPVHSTPSAWNGKPRQNQNLPSKPVLRNRFHGLQDSRGGSPNALRVQPGLAYTPLGAGLRVNGRSAVRSRSPLPTTLRPPARPGPPFSRLPWNSNLGARMESACSGAGMGGLQALGVVTVTGQNACTSGSPFLPKCMTYSLSPASSLPSASASRTVNRVLGRVRARAGAPGPRRSA